MRPRTLLAAAIAASGIFLSIGFSPAHAKATPHVALTFSAYASKNEIVMTVTNNTSKTVGHIGPASVSYDPKALSVVSDGTTGYPTSICTDQGGVVNCAPPSQTSISLAPGVSYGWYVTFQPNASIQCPSSGKVSKSVHVWVNWIGGMGQKNVNMSLSCQPSCGNGKLDAGEKCDLGTKNGTGVGCTSKCTIQKGYTCDSSSQQCSKGT